MTVNDEINTIENKWCTGIDTVALPENVALYDIVT